MSKFPTRISAARRNAEALLSRSKKQESTLKLEQEREHDAMVEKTARLRALRLAKEASDREAAASAPPSIADALPARLSSVSPRPTWPRPCNIACSTGARCWYLDTLCYCIG